MSSFAAFAIGRADAQEVQRELREPRCRARWRALASAADAPGWIDSARAHPRKQKCLWQVEAACCRPLKCVSPAREDEAISMEGCDMPKKTSSSRTDGPATLDACDLSRRSLLRLGLTGGAMLIGMPAFAVDSGPDAPARAGTLTIGADADPIGLDPTTVTAFSSFDFTGADLFGAAAVERRHEDRAGPCRQLRAAGRRRPMSSSSARA